MSRLIPKPSTRHGALIELAVIVALAVGLAFLVQTFIVKPYRIPSGSMEPTLDIGQRVLVERVSYHFGDPGIGAIVVFHPPQGAETQRCGAPNAGGARRERAPKPPRRSPRSTSSNGSSRAPATSCRSRTGTRWSTG